MAKAATVKARDVRPQAKQPDTVRVIGGANPAPAENPREVIGGNMPPADQIIGDVQRRLADDYAALETTTAATLAKARELPSELANEADRAAFGDIIRELRDTSKRAESHREAEKNPYLRAGQAVDGFFNAMKDRLGKAIDVLQFRLNAYQRKLAEAERVKREQEAAEAQRKANEARRAAEDEARRLAELQRQQELAEQKAAESTRPKVQQAAEVTARDVRGQEGRTDALIAQADQLQRAADHAQERTQATTADLVRQRTGAGAVITARTIRIVKVDNFDLLPLERLRPYIKRDELERAVKAWAKVEGDSASMPGVRIYDEDAAMVR